MLILSFIFGFFLGGVFSYLCFRSWIKKIIFGSIVIDHSTEEPYIFLESEMPMGDLISKKKVLLNVEKRNYVSQK